MKIIIMLLMIDVTAIILSSITVFGSLMTLVLQWLLRTKVDKLHHEVNGKMQQLIDSKQELGRKEGQAQEKIEQKEREDNA